MFSELTMSHLAKSERLEQVSKVQFQMVHFSVEKKSRAQQTIAAATFSCNKDPLKKKIY